MLKWEFVSSTVSTIMVSRGTGEYGMLYRTDSLGEATLLQDQAGSDYPDCHPDSSNVLLTWHCIPLCCIFNPSLLKLIRLGLSPN